MEYLIACGIFVIIMWQIVKKAGYRYPQISLLMFVPLLNIGLLFWIAFSEWPVHKKSMNLMKALEKTDRPN